MQSYLNLYAEPESLLCTRFDWAAFAPFSHTLVIPAYDETPDFIQRLNKNKSFNSSSALAICVINQPEQSNECDNNIDLWDFCHDHYTFVQAVENLNLFQFGAGALLLVDRFQPHLQINAKQGVGLARKIGCDIATKLIHNKVITTNWIHTTDADALLPDNYFEQTQSQPVYTAQLFNFEHAGENDAITKATQLYEQSLRFYYQGLSYAGSPYAFHTIGSCIAINATAYAQARGFPKRAGGEDFYLLNKLAKLGPINQLSGEPIKLQARRSSRAPFGTGPAVEKILLNPNAFKTYNPKVFVELKALLKHFQQWWNEKPAYTQWKTGLSKQSQFACDEIGMEQLFLHLQTQAKTEKRALHHVTQWFDGFKTLKFIHALQSNSYPPLPLADAVEQSKSVFK